MGVSMEVPMKAPILTYFLSWKRQISIIVFFGILLFNMSTAYAVDKTFTLVNNTGTDIYWVYFSPSADDTWGDDVLEDYILENKDALEITLSASPFPKYWDMRIENEKEQYKEYYEIELKRFSTIYLKANGASGK